MEFWNFTHTRHIHLKYTVCCCCPQ